MPLAAGARLGPYEVLSHLGDGGMGEVYRARDTRLDRTVALKVLVAAAASDPRRLERFRQEARAISRLSHPHICTLHDLGEQDGTLFLVMEHVQGRTLANRLDEGPLPIDEVLRYGAQIADALHAAHAEGVVHRDLKPANVMLTRQGVKLLDFGVARLRSAEEDEGADPPTVSHLTEEGEMLGTVPYMAPEQLEGRKVDARTDVFALGSTLYEMATGRRPFAANSRAGVIAAILGSEPVPVTTARPLAPPALDWAVRRCLAKDPDDRWQSARDVATVLRWIPQGDAAAPAAAPEVGRSRRKRRAWAATAVALVAGGAIGALVARGLAPSAPPPSPKFRRLTVRPGSMPFARFAADGQTVVYSAAPQGGPLELFLARPGSPEVRPLGLRPARLAALSSKDEIAYIRTPSLFPTAFGTLSHTPLSGGGARDVMDGVRDADWSPEGSELAVSRREGRLDVLEFPLGHRLHEAPAIWSLRVSRHGDRVAFMEAPFALPARGDLMVADRAGRKTTLLQREPAPLGLTWSPRDDEIWFGTPPSIELGEITAVSLDGRRRTLARLPGAVSVLDVFPDGRALVATIDVRGGLACRLGDAEERELNWLDTNYIEDLSADGALALVYESFLGGGEKGGIYLRPTNGSPAVRLGEGRPEALSPDGKWVLALGRDDGDWMLLPTGAGTARKIERGNVRTLLEASWLGDGRRVILTGRDDSGKSRLYVVEVEEGRLRPLMDDVTLPEGAVTLDRRHFFGSVQGRWFLFSADGGERRPVPHLQPDDNPLQWTADGRYLFVRRGGPTGPVPVEVDRIEVASGARAPWLKLSPRDPVGLLRVHPVHLLPGGSGYCYSYQRQRSDLYLVEGLR